jgi:hypothetical protein
MQDAALRLRPLSILAKLTGTDLLVQLWPIALRVARRVAHFRRGPVSPEGTFQFETDLRGLLRETGRLIIQWTINHREPRERQQMPRLVVWDGEYDRRGGQSPRRNLNGLFGLMVFRRFSYLPWEWIVDYYHACLYLTKLAEAIFGRGRQAFAWAAKRRRVLKQKRGGVFRVLRSVGALLANRGLVGSEDAYFKAYRLLRDRTEKWKAY